MMFSRQIVPLFLVGLIGCGTATTARRSLPPGATLDGQRPTKPPTPDDRAEERYFTDPTPGGVLGGPRATELARQFLAIAVRRHLLFEEDGRLAKVASFIAWRSVAGGAVEAGELDARCRRLGITEPVPFAMALGSQPEKWEGHLAHLLEVAPSNIPFNRFGLSVIPLGDGQEVPAIVISAARATLEPLPRKVEVGSSWALSGKLDAARYTHPEVVVTRPDGSAFHMAAASEKAFAVGVKFELRGVHRVELMARGPLGPEVVENFPIYVGVNPPALVVSPRASEVVDHRVDPTSRLFALLNSARSKAGAAPLVYRPELAEVALGHSRDMAEHGFFGHDSPTTGNVAARARAKGLSFPVISENIAEARSAEEAHHMLEESPAHRANMLHADLTDVGIGVVSQPDGAMFVTEVYAEVAKPIDLAKAPGELLERINQQRKAVKLAPLTLDPGLVPAAEWGARAYFSEKGLTAEQVIARTTNRFEAGGVNAQVFKRLRKLQGMFKTAARLEEAATFDKLLDPGALRAGIGVAQGNRAEIGTNVLAIVVVLGWPR